MRGWWNRKLDEISRTVNRLQTESCREPMDQEKATATRGVHNTRWNAIRAAKQSYIMLKLQVAGPQDV